MNKKNVFYTLISCLIIGSALHFHNVQEAQAAAFVDGKTLVLYDAASGSIPDASLMSFADFPFGVTLPVYSEDATVLDTTISGKDAFAGWISSGATIPGFPNLDRTAGVQVNFSVQMESESHTNNDRAGFSVIILDKDAKGIELSFWENEIWAKSDDDTGGLFKHGEGIAFATSILTEYQVTFVGDTYTLTANAQPLLTGPLRDYRAFTGFPDPYETPNFLFLGDNTTSAQARFRLRFVSVTGTEPMAPTSETLFPTSTPVPLPSFTAVATLPSSQPVIQLCPSGWLIGVAMLAGAMLSKKKCP